MSHSCLGSIDQRAIAVAGTGGIQPGMSARGLQALAADIARRRDAEARAELAERRHFEAMGLDYREVQQARAAAALQALAAAQELRSAPQGQLLIPGLARDVTLMELRGPGPLSPAQEAAMGVVGPAGWQRTPQPVGQQLELDFRGVAPGVNQIVEFNRPAERMAGERLARLLGASLAGGTGLVGVGLESLYGADPLGWSQ